MDAPGAPHPSSACRIVVARDPEEPADVFVPDLLRAGITRDAEVQAVSIADDWLPTSAGVARASSEAASAAEAGLARARASAEELARVLAEGFPAWTVRARAERGSPAWETIRIAEQDGAQLIVAGATSTSALERAAFGSTSYSIAAHARTSVRIVRPPPSSGDGPPLLLVGVDGSRDAQVAVDALGARAWSPGTRCLVALVMASGSMNGADVEQARRAEQALGERGLDVRLARETGDQKRTLIAIARREGADCIFVGARGRSGVARILLGGVSSSVVAGAHCSVEVVRPIA